jgi:hypothetical protein
MHIKNTNTVGIIEIYEILFSISYGHDGHITQTLTARFLQLLTLLLCWLVWTK